MILTGILGVALLLAIIVIVVLVVRNRELSQVSEAPPRVDDEEGTQVRIVGHRLVRLHGGVKVGSEFPIVSLVTIGRATNCTMSLNDPELSSVHAEVRLESGNAMVEDKGSTNGTRVNDEKLQPGVPRSLKDGDLIKLGGTTILYKSAA